MLDGTAHQRQAYAVPGMAKVIMEDGQRKLKLQQSVLTGALSYQVSNLLSEDSKLICPKHFFTQTLLHPNTSEAQCSTLTCSETRLRPWQGSYDSDEPAVDHSQSRASILEFVKVTVILTS